LFDLVIRGDESDIAIEDGRIAAIEPGLAAGRDEIDGRGLSIIPGLIDVHVHFNEPGRTEWEGAATGSRAFAAGGGTLFFDMPLNSSPCTVNVAAFDAKRAALERSSATDFGLWGGLVPGNAADLPGLAERGVVGFKAFMCDSGLPEFPRADEDTLHEGMRIAAKLGLPVAVHAESPALLQLASGPTVRDYLASRPVAAEVDAIRVATAIAGEAGAKLHIVHVSSGRGVAAALEARARGVDVSIETCPHYLFFTEEDMERIGAAAKCAPPLRSKADRDELWSRVLDGSVSIIGSDHSPAPPEMKTSHDFFRIWGGIAGVQATLAVLLQLGLPLDAIVQRLSTNPANRFGIANKGSLEVGMDADLALIRANEPFVMDAGLQRHPVSPYTGCRLRGKVVRTLVRGRAPTPGTGRFVRPTVESRETRCNS
jgi:allantoinase